MSFGYSPYSGGQYFQDTVPQQPPQPNFIGNSKDKASMIVMAPTKNYFQDVAVRPLMYNFDANLLFVGQLKLVKATHCT